MNDLSKVNTSRLKIDEIREDVLNTNRTNCITEIPQDINLELVDGTLTLKAGSKVYVPNGFEEDGNTPKFDVVIIESDISLGSWGSATGQVLIGLDSSNFSYAWGIPSTAWYSGNTAPTFSGTATTANWYDTVNNIIKSTTNSGSSWDSNRGLSLPFALCTRTSGILTSIDQVFNGFGYIGSTVFALPGVKGLIPNGRNADESLKNIEFVTDKVLVDGAPDAGNRPIKIFLYPDKIESWGSDNQNVMYYKIRPNVAPVTYCTAYIEDENKWIRSLQTTEWTKELICDDVGDYQLNNSNIVGFYPKHPFRAVDYNDKSTIVSWGMPDYSAAISITAPFTAPKDGIVIIVQSWTKTDRYTSVNGYKFITQLNASDAGQKSAGTIIVNKGDEITTNGAWEYGTFIPMKGAK